MAFDEEQFPTDISRGSRGGPLFNTAITRVNSGAESRNPDWADPLFQFNVKYGIKRFSQLLIAMDFFLARRGQAFGFRYKNFLDFVATNQPVGLDSTALPNTGGAINGSRIRQLQRLYNVGGVRTYTKDIVKPLAGIIMRKDAATFTQFSLDITTGVVTFDLASAESTLTVTGFLDSSNPSQLTITAHGLVTGDVMWIEGETIQTQWNNVAWTITRIDDDTLTIPIAGTTGFSGATGYVFAQTPNFVRVFDWSGQFDLAVRFATDAFEPTLNGPDIGDVPNLPIVETRDFK